MGRPVMGRKGLIMLSAFLKENVVKPALRRLGTVGAAALVFGGDWMCRTFDACGLVTQSGAEMVMTYVSAVALLAFDLALAYFHNRKQEK